MRILLTNDDGIDSPGIAALHEAIEDLGEILTVAPLTAQSAASHGITYAEPLMADNVRVNGRLVGVAVDGRPADCVKVALSTIWREHFGDTAKPDLTISGPNVGANVGINIIYSGTVGAAMESAFLGVPAIAVSLHIGERPRTCFPRAAEIARAVIDAVLASAESGLDGHSVININIPRTEQADAPMPPTRVVEMNAAPGSDKYERRVSPAGRVVGLELRGRGGKSRSVERFQVRGILGTPDTRCIVTVERDDAGRLQAVRAVGRGWGHGVGLCQFGAFGMALRGSSHEEILRHYYPGAELTSLDRVRVAETFSH